MPRVFNKHHGKAPATAVYVGRPSAWGNPFSHLEGTTAEWRVASREEAVSRYRQWIVSRLDAEPGLRDQLRSELAGRDLVCWCSPKACHADVLLEIANPVASTRNSPSTNRVYAGIGSRETPQGVLETMRTIGSYLARRGWTLRSGGAEGADSAFEEGARAAGGECEIWVPWRGFNGHSSTLLPSPQAFDLASAHHPAWARLSRGARALHARNGHQVLGEDLATPAAFVACWTKEGKGGGGTGQALRLAKAHAIPIFDLGQPHGLERLRDHLRAP